MIEPKRSTPGSLVSDIEVDQEYMVEIVKKLSFPRVYGSEGNEKAKEMIGEALASAIGVCWETKKAANVFAGDPATAKILIGAHYDSAPTGDQDVNSTPGADDNASAVAVMLAVAKALGEPEMAKIKQAGDLEELVEINAIANRLGILFIAFNGEEVGLRGSRAFVDSLETYQFEQVHILEMVGYANHRPNTQKNPMPGLLNCPTTGNFIGLVGNDESLINHIVEQAGVVNTPVLGFTTPLSVALMEATTPHLLRSDHVPFWKKSEVDKKIPTTMWTDTSEFRNPNYHQCSDTPDTLDYDYMADVAKLLISICRKFLNEQKTS